MPGGPTHQISDKVRVFVSSAIGECSEERKIARSAIEALNHEAILFELVGARPYPPRSLYLQKIDGSHIFIGIYKNNYGYIAKDMTISGVEDEYRHATLRGMPRLVYIFADATKRDTRLAELLNEMSSEGGITYFKFTSPDELGTRIYGFRSGNLA